MHYELFLLKSRGLPLRDRLKLWDEFAPPLPTIVFLPKPSLEEQYKAIPRTGLWDGKRHSEENKLKQAERMKKYRLNN